jgi:drug/metabolite transporter (DMT)-like permease
MVTVNIFAAIAAMFAWGFGDFIIQRGTRKIGDIETLAWIGVLGSIGITPFIWHDLALVATKSNFGILISLGIVSFFVGLANFEAYRRGKLSIVDVILEIELPIAVLLGIVFFHKSLSLVQFLLIILVSVGVILIAIEPGKIKKRHFFEKGIVLALVAAVGYAIVDFLTAIGANAVSPLLTIWFTWVTFTIICLLYLAFVGRLQTFWRDAKRYTMLVIGMGVVDTIAWVLFAFAVRNNEFAVTVAITQSYPAIALILGVAVNKERVAVHQYVGAALAILASCGMGLLIN